MAGKQTQTDTTKAAAPEPTPVLRPAAESTDPTVHGLLADLTALRDAGQTEAAAEVTARLAAQGLSA